MSSLRKSFGKRLRAIRKDRGFTQEQFAELTRLSVDFLSLMERGIAAPSFETLEILARHLNLTVMDLFDFPRETRGKK